MLLYGSADLPSAGGGEPDHEIMMHRLMEDALYDSQAIRRFVGVDLGRESVPDATTQLKFRHLLDAHTGLVYSVKDTSANESDVAHAHDLLHDQEH